MTNKKEGINENLFSTTFIDEEIVLLLSLYPEVHKMAEQYFDLKIYMRGDNLSIKSKLKESTKDLNRLLKQLVEFSNLKKEITNDEMRMLFNQLVSESSVDLRDFSEEIICVNNQGKPICPYTVGQKKYVKAIKENDITFGIGPAGTGKTYLAVAQAFANLKEGNVKRIILVRPVVEAGESLGFLPGDMANKIEPYLKPLYDAFYDLIPSDKFNRYLSKGIVELAPLAYMRGRTLNDSFIILDEAQNATQEQMKMFLTRLGFRSKAVITGDITQIDLQGHKKKSGLIEVIHILNNIEGIEFINLTTHDVVRHEIVQRIVRAYEEYDDREKEKNIT